MPSKVHPVLKQFLSELKSPIPKPRYFRYRKYRATSKNVITIPHHTFIDVARSWKIKVFREAHNGQYYAQYRHSLRQIALTSPHEHVFMHELCHAAHFRIPGWRKTSDVEREVIAEFAALALDRIIGSLNKNQIRKSNWYIAQHANYMHMTAYEAMCKVLPTVNEIVMLILKSKEENIH